MTIPAPLDYAQAPAPGCDAPWMCQRCGEGLDGACGLPRASSGCRLDAERVVWSLEQAGATLLAMRGRSPWPAQYRCALPESIQAAVEAYGYTETETRPAVPDAAAITRMDGTFRWLGLIPQHRFVVRRIVAARALTNVTTGRALIHWRALGKMLHCSHEACRVWHGQGIDMIVAALCNGR